MENKIKSLSKKNISVLEWMVVIVFIGVIFMSTLPKFSNLTVEARSAANQGIAEILQTTVTAAHKVWTSNGAPSTANGSNVVVEGQAIHVNYLGWPDSGKGLLPTALDCATLWNTLLNNAPLAGCIDCKEPCATTATNGCYITSARSTTCVFTLATNATMHVEYNLATGIVEGISE